MSFPAQNGGESRTLLLILAQALPCVGLAPAEPSPVATVCFVSGEGCSVISWQEYLGAVFPCKEMKNFFKL